MDAPAWVDELDLHPGPPEASMGTRSLEEARWLLVDDDWPAQREQARGLLRERRDEVLAPATTDVTAAAAVELGHMLDAWLAAHHPSLADNAHVGEPDPTAAAGLRVAEDLCILTPGAEGWLLAAGAVCFPSYWRLSEKVGRLLLDVHEPVPGYAGGLASRVDAFLGRLRPGQGVWRRNWSIHDEAGLFVPAHGRVERPTPVPHGRWLRSEYQTLRRLPATEAVVFMIRTQQIPVTSLATRSDTCAALAAALRSWTPARHAYKGGAVDDALIRWLETRG